MNELQNKELSPVVNEVQKMTTKEVAEILGVDVKTVQRAALSLDLDVERSGSSHTMLFDEAQVTAIKFEFLRNSNVLQSNNIPYQKYIDAGYFRVIESRYVTPNGETKISLKTVVFQRGVAYINKLLSKAVENA